MVGRMRRALVVAVLLLGGCGSSALSQHPGSPSTTQVAVGPSRHVAVRASTPEPDGLIDGQRVLLAAHSWTHA